MRFTRMVALIRIISLVIIAFFCMPIHHRLTSATPGPLKQVSIFAGVDATAPLELHGSDARQQLVVTGTYSAGVQRGI